MSVTWRSWAVVLAAFLAAAVAVCDEEAGAGEQGDAVTIAALRAELAATREAFAVRIAELEGRLAELEASTAPSPEAPGVELAAPEKTPDQLDLEAQLAAELGLPPAGQKAPAVPAAQPPAPGWSPSQPIVLAGGGGSRNFLNLSFDALVAGGGSTSPDVESLELGGHDPAQRGFTVQNTETVLEGAVDPYFRGQGNLIVQIDAEGETVVELEEAYLTTTSLPHNLQVKAGTYFSEFGRLNPQHPHSWDFVDQPLVNGRFLGPDGLRGPGARLSWLTPAPFYSELFLSVQNSHGETATSFRGEPGEELFGRVLEERDVRTAGDLLYVPRYAASFDLSDTTTLLLGASAALGPNATGQDTDTEIYGLDFFWKWKAPTAQAGFPFVKWQTEAMRRRYEAGAFASDTDGDGLEDFLLPAETLEDWGAYSQVLWGWRRGWVAGLRGDYVTGDEGAFDPDPQRSTRWRLSPSLTWYPTEFSKFRLQFNQDDLEGLDSEQSLWLQMEFILGAHAAHKF
jgi:hypothetical protein